jgi:hypothetical protein
MTVFGDVLKMVIISSILSLLLCAIAVLPLGASERLSLLLIMPRPKWPVFAVLAFLWGLSMKIGYWWVFQRYTFYGNSN